MWLHEKGVVHDTSTDGVSYLCGVFIDWCMTVIHSVLVQPLSTTGLDGQDETKRMDRQ